MINQVINDWRLLRFVLSSMALAINGVLGWSNVYHQPISQSFSMSLPKATLVVLEVCSRKTLSPPLFVSWSLKLLAFSIQKQQSCLLFRALRSSTLQFHHLQFVDTLFFVMTLKKLFVTFELSLDDLSLSWPLVLTWITAKVNFLASRLTLSHLFRCQPAHLLSTCLGLPLYIDTPRSSLGANCG